MNVYLKEFMKTFLLSCVHPALGVGYIINHQIDEYRKKQVDKASNDVMLMLIKENHPGLRKIVGDERMDEVRSLIKK